MTSPCCLATLCHTSLLQVQPKALRFLLCTGDSLDAEDGCESVAGRALELSCMLPRSLCRNESHDTEQHRRLSTGQILGLLPIDLEYPDAPNMHVPLVVGRT